MRRLWLIVAVSAIALAACGGGLGDPTSSTDPGSETRGEETSLASFFGWDGDSEAQQQQWRDQEVQIQESIRRCMAEQGFEYRPVLPPDSAFVVREFDQVEYAREHGFGITTWIGADNEDRFGEVWDDPNQEALEAMSEGERQAWYEALWGSEDEQMEGVTVEIDPETGEEMWMQEGYGAGCQGEAYEAIYGSPDDTQNLWEELQPAMEAMYEAVRADARIIGLDQDWSRCMNERGHQVTTMDEFHNTIYDDFQKRLEALLGPDYWSGNPFEGMSEDEIIQFHEEKSQEEIDAFYREWERTRLGSVDQAALEALQQEERDLAVDEIECRGDYWESYQKVSAEYEATFIAENRSTLERIREAQG